MKAKQSILMKLDQILIVLLLKMILQHWLECSKCSYNVDHETYTPVVSHVAIVCD